LQHPHGPVILLTPKGQVSGTGGHDRHFSSQFCGITSIILFVVWKDDDDTKEILAINTINKITDIFAVFIFLLYDNQSSSQEI